MFSKFIRYEAELNTLCQQVISFREKSPNTDKLVLCRPSHYEKIITAIQDSRGSCDTNGRWWVWGVEIVCSIFLPHDFIIIEEQNLKPEHSMRAAANAQLEGLTSFLEETLSKLGINVPVHLDEDEFAHNQTRFRVKTGSFKQTPVVHKESYLVSENSVMTYNKCKKTWKFKFDLKFENKDYGGGICYTPDAYMTIKGKFGINCPNDFIYLRAIINQK